MLTGVHETLRSAGRTLELSLGDAPGLDRDALRAAAAASGAENAARLIELLDRNPPAESLLDLSEYAVKGDDEYEQARHTASRRRSTPSPRVTANCSRSSSGASTAATRRRRTASRRSTTTTSSCGPATCSATTSRSASASSCVSAGLRRRVPGYEPAPVRADRPRRPRRALLRRGRVPVDLPVPARRRRSVQGTARPDR